MNISAPFIRRPIATTLLAVAILLAGIVAFFQLPIAPLPNVDFPTINVMANLPGASPETMASSVATPLERRFGRIAGLSEITSVSTLGATSLTLQFSLDRDVTAAARDVQAAINAAGGELPPNLPTRPTFRKVNPADAPILIVSLTSKTLPLAQVFDVANTILAQKVSQVDGVGQVFVGGGQQPAVRVQVDQAALAGLNLGMDDVREALAAATSSTPKGSIQGFGQTAVIGANDQIFTAKDYREVVISYQGNAAVRLDDVATVSDDVENNRVAAWFEGERAVLLIIRREPGANILDTIDRVKALLPQLSASLSPAIDVQIGVDRAGTIRGSVRDVEESLLLSIALVVLVVFLFLRNGRATLIPSIAIPLSLLGTFCAMYLLGYSLDNLSLMALTISTGFVVDDAIVVTENVMRYIEKGLKGPEAALKGAQEIGFTIVSITVSLLAVFIPILFMGGIIGRLFREFAVTLSLAIGISALISLTLTPMMCAYLLKPHKPKKGWLDWVVKHYERGVNKAVDHAWITVGIALATIALTVFLFITVPKGLFPQQDTGLITGFSEAAQDVSFASMKARQEQVNAILKNEPDLANRMAFIGAGQGGTLNTGNMFIALKPKKERKGSADDIINKLRPKLAQIPGIRVMMQAAQDVRIGGRNARTQYQYTLQDANLAELREWAPKVMAELTKLPELRDVATDQQTAGLELDVTIDRDTASRLGVSAKAIDDALYDAFGQRQVATSFTQLNYYRVVLETKVQRGPEAIKDIYVASDTGGRVPLGVFSKVTPATTSLSITHQGQFPAVTLSFNLAPDISLGQAIDAIHKIEQSIGIPRSIQAGFSGTAQAFTDSLSSQPILIGAALLAVYIVLGMLYESLIHPVTILSTLPSAGVGALLALLLTGTDLSIIALIGIILLIGIVKKNAIMMIDFAIEAERNEGKSPKEAIVQAAVMRFRPIMMTTMAALLGGLPLALGQGDGAELRRPLGIAIVGGLLFSQMLTLFTTPAVYLVLDRLRARRTKNNASTLQQTQ